MHYFQNIFLVSETDGCKPFFLYTCTILITFLGLFRNIMYMLYIFGKIKVDSFENSQNQIKKFKWRRTPGIPKQRILSLRISYSLIKNIFFNPFFLVRNKDLLEKKINVLDEKLPKILILRIFELAICLISYVRSLISYVWDVFRQILGSPTISGYRYSIFLKNMKTGKGTTMSSGDKNT